jgi:hypothetical protein
MLSKHTSSTAAKMNLIRAKAPYWLMRGIHIWALIYCGKAGAIEALQAQRAHLLRIFPATDYDPYVYLPHEPICKALHTVHLQALSHTEESHVAKIA